MFQGPRSQNPSSGQYSAAYSHSHLMEPTLTDLPEAVQPQAASPMHAPHASGSPTASENTDFMSVASGSLAPSTTSDSAISNNPFQGNVNPFSLGVVNPLFGQTTSSQGGSPVVRGGQVPGANASPEGSFTTGKSTPGQASADTMSAGATSAGSSAGSTAAGGHRGAGHVSGRYRKGGKSGAAPEDPWAAIRGM